LTRWILSIADDLTGALEAGAQFAGAGLRSRVHADTAAAPEAGFPVLVIDTETRHLPPAEAYSRVLETAICARQHTPSLVYKKTDSTLRGNIAAELRALVDVFPDQSVIYVPAYPAMGRTVRDGRLFVHGVPAHLGAFAADLLNPVRDNDIRALLAGLPVQVIDGDSDADVAAAAKMIASAATASIAAGPAALAGALARCLPLAGRGIQPFPRLPRCLLVNGSLHPTSQEQVAFATTHGCLDAGWRTLEDDSGGLGLDRARRTGEAVRRSLEAAPADAVIVFGGDTASGVHHALGGQPFEPLGEILPGVPLSRCGALYWITKAGGFGEPDVLCEIRRRLT
jgi:uncharacterized protein YgbK (DUF1537 family)